MKEKEAKAILACGNRDDSKLQARMSYYLIRDQQVLCFSGFVSCACKGQLMIISGDCEFNVQFEVVQLQRGI